MGLHYLLEDRFVGSRYFKYCGHISWVRFLEWDKTDIWQFQVQKQSFAHALLVQTHLFSMYPDESTVC
jgi:hypothetical protein